MEKKSSSKKKEFNQENASLNQNLTSETIGQQATIQADHTQPDESLAPLNADELNQGLIDRIKELETKYADISDRHLRLFSEFDNYRKRTAKERIEFSKMASAEMLTALLPVVDDLERASTLQSQNNDVNNDLEGIALIYNKLTTILKQKGVEVIDTVHIDFDTDLHEAITHITASDPSLKGKVVEVLQKGYMLNGKVIRYARVVVAN
ncbi:MAG TPA: nucleotide exchange factor GrpE [Bacteroidales bacterium]|nr:nucleotide exchange factor GrpE [Bacteroidales bacterium]